MTAPFDPAAVLSQLTLEEKVCLLAGADLWRTAAVPRLGVPYIKLTDGPNGARGGGDFNDSHPSALFPSPSCLGSTWDHSLARAMGEGIAEDGIKKQCHVILGPTINIQRDPRAGRYFESYSEDPVLTGELASQWITGCQSKPGMAATMKHFVGNESETDRRNVSSDIPAQALREVYLEPFRRVMKGLGGQVTKTTAQPACVMTAYNRLNGVSSSENTFLMQDVLRKEWGFDGLVMSDWLALHSHGLQATDLEMPGPTQHRKVDDMKRLISKGEISMLDIDSRVLKVLELVAKVAPLGYRSSPSEEKESSVDMAKVSETIRRIGAEGAVLLKNDNNLLPVQPRAGLRIACIGSPWVQAVQSGGGSANLTPQKVTEPLAVLKEALAGEDVSITHHNGCHIHNFPPLLEAETKVEYYKGRSVGEGKLVGTQTLGRLDLPAIGSRPSGLEANNFWLRVSFDLTAGEAAGNHNLGLICLGSLQLTTSRGEESEYKGEWDLFEYFLNPSKMWKPLAIRTAARETVRVTLDYLPQHLDDQLKSTLAAGFRVGFESEVDEEGEIALAARVAGEADIALVMTATGKDWESEGFDRSHLDLPKGQNALVEAVCKAQHTRVAVLNITGSVVHMPWKEQVETIVQCWFGGQEGGEALVDVVLGRGRAPASGRMANSWPERVEDHPSGGKAAHFPGEQTAADGLHVDYVESRLVGYKHYNSQPHASSPAFLFGQGLGGYTSFEAGLVGIEGSCNSRSEHYDVCVRVKNVGRRSGKYVVQLYVRPQHIKPGQPVQKLAAFRAVHLQAGSEETVVVQVDGDAFSEWDEQSQCWQVAQATYTIALANSAAMTPEATLGTHAVDIHHAWSWTGVR